MSLTTACRRQDIVDQANYELIYTAPLTADVTLNSIWEKFNIDHPKDFKGTQTFRSDIVVLHQNGEDTAHYVDSGSFRNVPGILAGVAAYPRRAFDRETD